VIFCWGFGCEDEEDAKDEGNGREVGFQVKKRRGRQARGRQEGVCNDQ